jgi:TonB family protein
VSTPAKMSGAAKMSAKGSTKMRRARRRSAGWAVALGASALVHAGVLVGLLAYGQSGGAGAAAAAPDARWAALELPPIAVPVEVARVDPATLLPLDVPPVARPLAAPPGERDNPIPTTRAPAEADGRDRRAPAPDSGLAGGAPPDHAFRRDRSTLHARLSDVAAEAQPARLRISRRRASPQAIRRESTIGIGDSVRSVAPSRAPISPAAAGDPALGGDPAGASPLASPSAPSDAPPLALPVDRRPVSAPGVGPLDAEAGRRSFDVQQPGRAADDRTQRTASSERHPGLIDFSRAAAPRPIALADGRGPSGTPGAVARPVSGTAPAELGAVGPRTIDVDVDERTADRRYQRYFQEILRRVNAVDDFPRALALRLEQGETIVGFVVGADGRLIEGPSVLKGAGFQEFDAAALRKVRRAAPFPPLPNPGPTRSLRMSLRVTFDNPVVR